MELDYALLANYAEEIPRGQITLVGAGIDSLYTDTLPITFSPIYLAFRIFYNETDLQERYLFYIHVLDSEGKDLIAPVQTEAVPSARDGEVAPGIAMVICFQRLTFPAHGAYQVRILSSGHVVKELPLRIRPRSA
jgi:hypothetical protein